MKYLQNGIILGRSRTCLNVLVRSRMAEVTSSSLVGSTTNNGSSATENYRTQRSLSRNPEILTATQLQPRIEFVRVPNKPPLVLEVECPLGFRANFQILDLQPDLIQYRPGAGWLGPPSSRPTPLPQPRRKSGPAPGCKYPRVREADRRARRS